MVNGRFDMKQKATSVRVASLLRQETRGDLYLTIAGHMPEKKEWIHQPFNVTAVGLVVGGRGTYQAGRQKKQEIGPGSLFVVRPGVTYHYGPEEGTSWDEYHVGCGGPGLKRWKDAGWLWTDGSVRQLGGLEGVLGLFGELLMLRRRQGLGDADRAILVAERLMLELYYAQKKFHIVKPAANVMDGVMKYCRENLTRELDFKVLASRHAMSYSSLRQQMVKLIGESPARYLARLRCDRARTLLMDTRHSIKVIAAMVGIADPYTFSRTFKRCVGVSPEHYRHQSMGWIGQE